MRLLDRNKQTVYYRNYTGMTAITDTNNLETGEYTKSYGAVKSVRAYVKSAVGNNEAEPFGDFTNKQRTIYYINGAADIDEFSLVWVGIDPEVTPEPEEGTTPGANDPVPGEPTVPHNFTVDGVAVGLNHTRVAIRRVEKSVN